MSNSTAQSQARDKAAVMLAFAEGKAIEVRELRDTEWLTLARTTPEWNWQECDYRIKREPREFWINAYSPDCFNAHATKEKADEHGRFDRTECIRVREIL